jgi:hypothetical protein
MLEKDPARRWSSMDDVVAVCGRPSLRHDDPIRREMITLAQGAAEHAGPKTPTSPIVLSRVRARAPVPRRRWIWPGIAATTAVLALGLWWSSPWSPRGRRASDSAPAAAVRPDSSRLVSRPEPPPQPPPPAPPRRASVTAGRAAGDSLARLVAQRDDSLIGSLRASALGAEERAALAGATPADLSGGHTAFARAESLATARRVSEAMMQFATAASLWADAERASRSRATQNTEPPAPSPVPVATVPVDPKPEIQNVVDAYAGALESRDIEQVRRAYPGLTAAQQESWRGFFDRVRNLKANLSVASLSVADASAEATVSGVYEYDNASTGRAERRPVTFHVTLARDANRWRITAIR